MLTSPIVRHNVIKLYFLISILVKAIELWNMFILLPCHLQRLMTSIKIFVWVIVWDQVAMKRFQKRPKPVDRRKMGGNRLRWLERIILRAAGKRQIMEKNGHLSSCINAWFSFIACLAFSLAFKMRAVYSSELLTNFCWTYWSALHTSQKKVLP